MDGIRPPYYSLNTYILCTEYYSVNTIEFHLLNSDRSPAVSVTYTVTHREQPLTPIGLEKRVLNAFDYLMPIVNAIGSLGQRLSAGSP